MTTEHTEETAAQKRGGIEEITLPVSGMTCAACVRKVEKALTRLPGVEEANVNLSAGKAGVTYDPNRVALPQMEQAITEIGYEVPLARLDLLVLGMTPGHCDLIIEKALRALPGIRDVVVNCATDTVGVDYVDVAVSPAAIKKTIRDLGYDVSEKGEGEAGADRER
jgi:Cu+-exporting ATPase